MRRAERWAAVVSIVVLGAGAVLATGCAGSGGSGDGEVAATDVEATSTVAIDESSGSFGTEEPASTSSTETTETVLPPTTERPTTTVTPRPVAPTTAAPPLSTTTTVPGPPIVVASNGTCSRTAPSNWLVSITFTFVNGIADNGYLEEWNGGPRGPVAPGTSVGVSVDYAVGGANPQPPTMTVDHVTWWNPSGDRRIGIAPVTIVCPA